MDLNWIDISILLVIGLSVITGLLRGFVKEVIALCTWILALWLAYSYSESVEYFLKPYIDDEAARSIIAFIAVLLATLLAGAIVNALLSFILKRSGIGGTDRLLGMGFGFVRGVLIVSLIMMAVKMTSLPYEKFSAESKVYSKFDPIVNSLYVYMPGFIKKLGEIDKQKNAGEQEEKHAAKDQQAIDIIFSS